jgi:hypothetical protein
MKKLLVFVLFVMMGTTVFAQIPELKISAGAGGFFSAALGGGLEATVSGNKLYTHYIGGGVFAFVDATFVEAALGFSGGAAPYTYISSTDDGSFTALDISLLGKWPFNFGTFTVFPLLGIDYQIFLSENNAAGASYINTDYNNSLWFKAGVGVDYVLTEILYIRGEVLYGVRLSNKYEEDLKDYYISLGYTDVKILLGHGPTIKIGVGYKF